MKTVIVASGNPVKLEATRRGFERLLPGDGLSFRSVGAPSGVSDQPASDDETLLGATNRAQGARRVAPAADFWVGIEGGVTDLAGGLAAFAWVVVLDRQRSGLGRTATFFLPARVAELVRRGVELGSADDLVFGRADSKQANGAVGLLTGDVVDRTSLYEQAVVLALIPFRNPELY